MGRSWRCGMQVVTQTWGLVMVAEVLVGSEVVISGHRVWEMVMGWTGTCTCFRTTSWMRRQTLVLTLLILVPTVAWRRAALLSRRRRRWRLMRKLVWVPALGAGAAAALTWSPTASDVGRRGAGAGEV
jgi:hypothetical protein